MNYSGYVQIAGESESTGIEAQVDWQLAERFSVGGFVSQLDAEGLAGMHSCLSARAHDAAERAL